MVMTNHLCVYIVVAIIVDIQFLFGVQAPAEAANLIFLAVLKQLRNWVKQNLEP
jgi:hypothetical protein